MIKRTLFYSVALITMLGAIAISATPNKAQKTAKDDPYLLLELFGSAFETTRTEYVDEVSDRKLIEAAINGMLSSLDPHSNFLNADTFRDMQIQTKGEFGGVGMEVSMENGLVRVVAPIDGTPAAKAGIQPGDLITHIDDEAVMGLNLNEAVEKLRGKPKTVVRIMVRRKNQEPFEVTLTRDIIKIESVRYEVKNDDIGYIRIITFSDNTAKNVEKAVQELTKKIGKDKIRGFVIDLRNDPGGLLDEAQGVADAFLDQGEIVSTRSKKTEETVRLTATKGDITNGLPLVVLINEGSASASEIVAGALQDHKRAVIVGTPSFGKGSVQSVKPIPGYGAIKITTARYYTPSGRSIQAEGIQPDILIPRAEVKEEEIIKGYSESNLPGALGKKDGEKNVKKNEKKSDEKVKSAEKTKSKEKVKADPEDASDTETKKEEKQDYQLDRALDILKSISVYQERVQSK
ncbi:MAG: S41 family peptidase [Alphaproteobacteria bacterium]|nr:S41 family peptidase [Alphaproteobacteria bacterium]